MRGIRPMRRWLRPLTYAAAAACGLAAIFFPAGREVLILAASTLAAWATRHPADAATPEALSELGQQAADLASRRRP